MTETTDWTRLADAAAMAMRLHAAQRRKGTEIPYISHLLAVAGLVLEHGGDQDQAVAAMLHDVIEDCGAEHEAEIAARFGPRVVAMVRACTDAQVFPKPPWRARKEAHLTHMEHVPAEALPVLAADKLHNARAIMEDLRAEGVATLSRFNGGVEGTLWYFGAMAEVIARRMPGRVAQALAREVGMMEEVVRAAR